MNDIELQRAINLEKERMLTSGYTLNLANRKMVSQFGEGDVRVYFYDLFGDKSTYTMSTNTKLLAGVNPPYNLDVLAKQLTTELETISRSPNPAFNVVDAFSSACFSFVAKTSWKACIPHLGIENKLHVILIKYPTTIRPLHLVSSEDYLSAESFIDSVLAVTRHDNQNNPGLFGSAQILPFSRR